MPLGPLYRNPLIEVPTRAEPADGPHHPALRNRARPAGRKDQGGRSTRDLERTNDGV